jgi:tetratricopeptide (TPR) repeat protein/transcriptional regulator with XRE-family HTH domain
MSWEANGFADLLRAFRQRAGLTQVRLADMSRLGVRTIRDLERGRSLRPHTQSIQLLANALRLDEVSRGEFERRAAGRSLLPEPDYVPELPRALPSDTADFVGRSEEVVRARDSLNSNQSAAAVVIVLGPPGVGKTALAVHVAHGVTSSFPDGQLFTDLQGAGPAPLEPSDVLASFLRALGVSGWAVPADLQERIALYRTRLADRRVLIVLDNAANQSQVRPLLPGCGQSGVLVTSRGPQAGLVGASSLSLGVFEITDAVSLLAKVAGPARVAAELETATTIAGLCGCLPLAVRIAAARLANRPHWRLSDLATRLADERKRLDELGVGDLEVRASFRLSYDRLDPEAQAVFRFMAMMEAPDLAAWAIAALTDTTVDEAERTAERLVDVHLLGVTADLRYHMHDLLRVFGRECLLRDESDSRRARAVDRLLDASLTLVMRADALLGPTRPLCLPKSEDEVGPGAPLFASRAESMAWLEAERPALVRAALLAATQEQPARSWQLAAALSRFLLIRTYWTDWQLVNQAALAAARRVSDRPAEIQCLSDLAAIAYQQRRFADALALLEPAVEMSRTVGDRLLECRCQTILGLVYGDQHCVSEANVCHERALLLSRQIDSRYWMIRVLLNVGCGYCSQKRYEQAIDCLQPSLALAREDVDLHTQGLVLHSLGEVYWRQGRVDDAINWYRRSLLVREEIGDRYGQGETLTSLGHVYRDMSRFDQASASYLQALAIYRELKDESRRSELVRCLAQLSAD